MNKSKLFYLVVLLVLVMFYATAVLADELKQDTTEYKVFLPVVVDEVCELPLPLYCTPYWQGDCIEYWCDRIFGNPNEFLAYP